MNRVRSVLNGLAVMLLVMTGVLMLTSLVNHCKSQPEGNGSHDNTAVKVVGDNGLADSTVVVKPAKSTRRSSRSSQKSKTPVEYPERSPLDEGL